MFDDINCVLIHVPAWSLGWGLTSLHPGAGSLVFRMLHCFGGTCTGVERGMMTHFTLAALCWWETSGVRLDFSGDRMSEGT